MDDQQTPDQQPAAADAPIDAAPTPDESATDGATVEPPLAASDEQAPPPTPTPIVSATVPWTLLQRAERLLQDVLAVQAVSGVEASDHLPVARDKLAEVVALLRRREAFLGASPSA